MPTPSPHSQQLPVSIVDDYAETRFSLISLLKTKICAKPFLPFYMGPGGVNFRHKMVEHLVTRPLKFHKCRKIFPKQLKGF